MAASNASPSSTTIRNRVGNRNSFIPGTSSYATRKTGVAGPRTSRYAASVIAMANAASGCRRARQPP